MIGKIIVALILVFLILYLADYLHLLSFASTYGVSVPPAPSNLSIGSFATFVKQSFST